MCHQVRVCVTLLVVAAFLGDSGNVEGRGWFHGQTICKGRPTAIWQSGSASNFNHISKTKLGRLLDKKSGSSTCDGTDVSLLNAKRTSGTATQPATNSEDDRTTIVMTCDHAQTCSSQAQVVTYTCASGAFTEDQSVTFPSSTPK